MCTQKVPAIYTPLHTKRINEPHSTINHILGHIFTNPKCWDQKNNCNTAKGFLGYLH